MEKMFGDWYRTANLAPTDDLLKRRWQGVEKFADQANTEEVLDLARLFYQRRPKTDGFEDKLREALHAEDSAFEMKGNDVELATLAGACLLHLVKGRGIARSAACSAALALICPSLQGKGVCGVVPAIETEARAHLAHLSARLRSMSAEECEDIELPSADELSKVIVAASKGGAWPDGGKQLIAWLEAIGDATSQVSDTLQAIQKDMLLHREESDILWWMTAGFSRDLEKPMSELELAGACVLAGKELGNFVKVLPGPYAAEGVIHTMLLKGDSKGAKTITLKQAVNATDRTWRTNWIAQGMTGAAFDLCPVLFAVEKSLETQDESSWTAAFKGVTQIDAAVEMLPTDLALQVYQETLFMKALYETGGGR